jgi:hypothetical protein
MWRNWQTRRLQVPVGLIARGGSTPLIRIKPAVKLIPVYPIIFISLFIIFAFIHIIVFF